MAEGPFKYQGAEWSSKLPKITIDGKEMSREKFWEDVVKKEAGKLPPLEEGKVAQYVATGGGYGSNEKLLAFEGLKIPAIKGETYRSLAPFVEEMTLVRKAVEEHFGSEAIAANPKLVEQTLRSFYSDEVNTKIAKEVVKAAFPDKAKGFAGTSVAHESASIYQDTIDRVTAAGMNGAETTLIAGDMNLETAKASQSNAVNKFNTAASYKLFAARFTEELVPLFDKVRLYNTDEKPPVLIAEKKGKGQELKIYDQEKYDAFLKKKDIDMQPYTKEPGFKSSAINLELWQIIQEKFKLGPLEALEPAAPPKNQFQPPKKGDDRLPPH